MEAFLKVNNSEKRFERINRIGEEVIFHFLKALILKLFEFKKASITTFWVYWSQVKVFGEYITKAKSHRENYRSMKLDYYAPNYFHL